MKKGLTFILGMASGVVLMLIILFFLGLCSGQRLKVESFDKPGEILSFTKVEVQSVYKDGSCFVEAYNEEKGWYETQNYYLPGNGKKMYYNDQQLTLPKGKCFRQTGIVTTEWGTFPVIGVYKR